MSAGTLVVRAQAQWLTIVSLNDLYLLSDSEPVVSSMGTTRVGTVPFMLILATSAQIPKGPLDILEVR
jgi:hypothetical protein